MTYTYQDPKTGFYITVPGEPPAPAEPKPQGWGDVGQGMRGSASPADADPSDFQNWLKNKDLVNRKLNRDAGNRETDGLGFGPARR